jgi:hypothetical protein
MPEDYTVQAGDCMSSIAYERGFFWQTLWNDPANAALKARRKNPNVLMTGDIVHIPDLTIKQEPGATEKTHKFMLKGVPEKLRIKLLDGNSRRGKTDGSGELVESIPPNAMTGKLIFPAPELVDETGKHIPAKPKNQVMTLRLGNLNPISEVSGLKARLANLWYYKGPIDENLDDPAKQAVSAFQTKQGLPATGVADEGTKGQLQKVHGS